MTGAAGFFRSIAMLEAVASVSMSHDGGCSCKTCLAAKGDMDALTEILTAVADLVEADDAERSRAQT